MSATVLRAMDLHSEIFHSLPNWAVRTWFLLLLLVTLMKMHFSLMSILCRLWDVTTFSANKKWRTKKGKFWDQLLGNTYYWLETKTNSFEGNLWMNFKEIHLHQIIHMPSLATVFLCKSVFYGEKLLPLGSDDWWLPTIRCKHPPYLVRGFPNLHLTQMWFCFNICFYRIRSIFLFVRCIYTWIIAWNFCYSTQKKFSWQFWSYSFGGFRKWLQE